MLTLTNVSTLIGGFRAIHDLSLEIARGNSWRYWVVMVPEKQPYSVLLPV